MTDARSTATPALKERAGVVNALLDGAQTVLVRHPTLDPGDLEDEGWFALYPAYSHQRPERYRDRYEDYYHRASAKPEAGVPIRAVAKVREEYAVSADELDALARHYVYAPDGLRDKYGPDESADETADLRVLLLRVAELETPKLIEERDAYRGCRAWIELDDAVEIDFTAVTPVLDEPAFAERRAAIRDSIV